ncbi:MAG: HEAT repeat domain-containing protein [Acidobacteria bacterium]|nr:HEAT repeat domain-containing protein [Acidobacteriota bacterium]MCA1650882.1 HEAT repeat domain-containing protein [Acidobacteriota bacterium]
MKYSALVLVAALLAGPALKAQVRDRAAPASTVTEAATIAKGWAALAAGRPGAAAQAAAEVLARMPANHSALALHIEALSAAEPLRGLDAYEAHINAQTGEDVGLLEPVARGALQQIARSEDPELRRTALRLLSRAGVTAAREALAASAQPNDRIDADAVLAGGGDAAALKRLEAVAASADVPDKKPVIQALASVGAAAVQSLVAMLQARNGPERAAIIAALGKMRSEPARPVIKQAMKDPDPFVRASAAVALARLRDAEGQSRVQQMLASEVPDIRLMAAEAWDGQDGPWVNAITPLLENRDGLTRFHAARLIAPVNPELAKRTLQEGLADPNPVIRAESAEIMEQSIEDFPLVADLGHLRRLLRERDQAVLVYAAGAILAVARGGK